MKITHWSITNNSGMANVAATLAAAEKKLGCDSSVCDPTRPEAWMLAEDSDVQVVHTHFPDQMRKRITKPLKLVWIGHGTPEHVFQSSVENGSKGGYAPSDSFMLMQFWLQTADAVVTFWDRHKAIYESLCDKGRRIHCVPLGVNKELWKPFPTRGKFTGKPSVFSSENPHYIKWPLDLLLAWPWVRREIPECHLHLTYMPRDQHRWFFPLVNRNGAGYASFISEMVFHNEDLRNTFCSTDFYVGLVRYGDLNVMSLQANACGAKTISYVGNPHSDFWVPEGDQRIIAAELVKIFNGEVSPRAKTPPPDISETAAAMLKIYEPL